MTGGNESLPAAATVLIFAWATDLLDGPLARRDRSGRQTWVGTLDLQADISVATSVLGYLTIAGFVPLWAGMAYLAVSVALLWYFRSVHIGWAVQAIPYGLMLYMALRHALLQGVIAVAWLILALIVTWPRFPNETVPSFLRGMRSLGQSLDEER